jgi:hypothetical protein
MGSFPADKAREGRLAIQRGLLKELDGHEGDLDSGGADILESMLRQVGEGRELTERQMAWVQRMIERLDS